MYVPSVAEQRYSDEQIDAAIDAISDPGAFREAEQAVAKAAPRLQLVLAEALNACALTASFTPPSSPLPRTFTGWSLRTAPASVV